MIAFHSILSQRLPVLAAKKARLDISQSESDYISTTGLAFDLHSQTQEKKERKRQERERVDLLPF